MENLEETLDKMYKDENVDKNLLAKAERQYCELNNIKLPYLGRIALGMLTALITLGSSYFTEQVMEKYDILVRHKYVRREIGTN